MQLPYNLQEFRTMFVYVLGVMKEFRAPVILLPYNEHLERVLHVCINEVFGASYYGLNFIDWDYLVMDKLPIRTHDYTKLVPHLCLFPYSFGLPLPLPLQ
jgi:hypothetical protein